VAAPVAVELLLPMGSARGRSFENGDEGAELQEQCARKRTMAAEWDGQFTPPLLFISPLKICGRSWPSMVKWERQSGSSHPCVGTAEATASTTHGNQGDRVGFFSLTRGTCG
jgi:hypothetical protein